MTTTEKLAIMCIIAIMIFCLVWAADPINQKPDAVILASWYSEESVKLEGSSGVMANGHNFDDTKYTCASWDFPFGTSLLVTNRRNGRNVQAVVTDRGPAKRLYREGRKIDLSKGAFAQISDLKWGVIPVKIKEINE